MSSDAEYRKKLKEMGLLEKATANKAYMEGYEGKADSLYATPSKVGIGKTLHEQYLKGKEDKAAGKPSSIPHVLAEPVPIGARRRGKKTKKGKRKARKSTTRRR